jgi:MFS family permease
VKGVFRLSAYRRLLLAYALNELAASVGALALTVLVYRRTGSAIAAAGYFLCSQFVPALAAPAVVARLDNRPARGVLPVLYLAEGLMFCLLGLLVGSFSLAPVLVLALLDGVCALTARAVARTATVDVLSPAGLLPEGNAITNAAFSVCFMAGPALGGVVVATGGIRAMLFTVAGAFAAIAVVVATKAGLPKPSPDRPLGPGRVRAALVHLRARPLLGRLLALQALGVVFFTIALPVEIVFVRHSLHAGAGGYGALLALWGTGAIGGSAIYARWRRFPARVLIAGGAAALALGYLVMAAAPSLGVAFVGALIGGAGNGIEAVAVRTALQEQVEDRWMGLMMGLNESVLQAMPGAGIVLGGAIAALAGPRAALAVAGAGAFAISVATWLILAPGRRRSVTADPPAARGPAATAGPTH